VADSNSKAAANFLYRHGMQQSHPNGNASMSLKSFLPLKGWGRINFFDTLGDRSLKQGLSIGTTFDPC
jgi:hypothetical protein